MNCPLCEAPVFENVREDCTKYDGAWYHSPCLYEEMPELNPDREPTSAEEDAYSALDISYSHVMDQARSFK